MFIIGGEVYEDEEVMELTSYENSIYERDPEEYIYEDEYDELAIRLENRLQLKNVVVSI